MTEGYQRKFVKPGSISDALKCIICSDVYKVPMRLFCSHTYCAKCIEKWKKTSNNGCPQCRQHIDNKKIGPDLIAKNIIDELEVYCIVQECDWKGRSDLLKEHYQHQCIMRDISNNTHKNHKSNKKLEQTVLDASVQQKINQNVAKGSLQARLLTKNVHLQESMLNSRNVSKAVEEKKQSTFDFLEQLFD